MAQAALALRALEKRHRQFLGDRPILKALAAMERDRGHREAAFDDAMSLVALTPDDPESQALLMSLC